jgi:hypothetical protein
VTRILAEPPLQILISGQTDRCGTSVDGRDDVLGNIADKDVRHEPPPSDIS